MVKRLFNYKREFIVATFFLLLTSLIISIWFKDGLIYGGGDVGLPTFNPIRILNISLYPWWEAQAPGFLIPLSITSVPFEFGLSILQTLGFSNLMLQALTFFILFFLMGFGMYLFLLTLFKRDHYLSLIGALFYLFNPYMLIQVWHRFVHTSIFFVALLPYLAIFWRKWIKEGKVRYLLIFLLINLLGSHLFGTLAFIVTLWLFLFTFTILEATIPFSDKRAFLIQIFRLGVGFVSWLLTNSWWLIPTLFIGSAQYGQQYNQDSNLVSMILISKQAILPFTFQLINHFTLYQQLDFGAIYNTFLFKLIPWLGVSVVLIGLISSLRKKQFAFFSIFTLLIIFLAKGSSTPLGNLFIWGFRHFFFIGVIRNPSEKIGILLPFLYSVLFVLGLVFIKDYLEERISKKNINFIFVFFLLPNIIFCWPIFVGKVFGNIDSPASIKVPDSYIQVNNFIKNQLVNTNGQDQGRILHLPLSTSEALTYNWDAGYHGTDPSVVLFDSLPSISRNMNLPKFDDPLKGLSFIFMYPYSQNKDSILKALGAYNVRFIILHEDADWLTDGITSPEEIKKVLDDLPFLRKVDVSGSLSVYKLTDEYFQPKIVLSVNPDHIKSGENNSGWLFLAAGNRSLITESPNSRISQDIYQYLGKSIIFPDKSFRYYQASGSALLSDTFHNSVIDILNQVMQQAQSYGNINARDSIEKLLSGVQLLRNILVNGQNSSANEQILNQYQDIIGGFFAGQLNFSGVLLYLDKSMLRLVFQEQLMMLEQLKTKYGDNEKILINEMSNKIIELLIKDDFYPKSFIIDDIKIGTDRQVFIFSIPTSSQYKIFMTKAFDPMIFDSNLIKIPFFIDGKAMELNSTLEGETLSFGEYKMEEGLHEISYPILFSKNLLDLQEIKLSQGKIENGILSLETTANTPSFFEIPFSGIEGEGLYHFNMEVSFPRGRSFYFQLLQDSDPLNPNKEPIMQINQYITKEEIGEGWRNINFDTTLRMTTKSAKLRIILSSDISILGTSLSLAIRNISVQKILNNTIFLKTENSINEEGFDNGIIKLVHPTPISYFGEIEVEKPSFLLFKETYNPGWTLTLRNGHSVDKPKDHLIGDLYGNVWFIETPGKYSFEIKFDPIKHNTLGFWLSFVAYLLFLFLIVWGKIRRKTYE